MKPAYPLTNHLRALILDMDGVLWRGSQPIGDLHRTFDLIREHQWKVCLATNNATLSTKQYVDKLAGFKVSIAPDQIVNSSQAVAHYLLNRHPQGGKVYIVGEAGLVDTLASSGFQAVDMTPEEANLAADEILAVVAAMDRKMTYEKLTVATRLIRSGVQFIGTNPDRTFPTPLGLVPGAGAILAALETATDVKPVICGKPSPEMYQVALERMDAEPYQTLVVGDRLETDIAGGQALGCYTALVLSGVTSPEAASQWAPPPTVISKDLTTLLENLSSGNLR